MVVAVAEDSPGAEAGIRPGDVVVSVDGHDMEDLSAWEQARTLLADRRDPLTVLIRTGTSEQYVQLVPRPAGLEN
jgi:regulator of sigma E protease